MHPRAPHGPSDVQAMPGQAGTETQHQMEVAGSYCGKDLTESMSRCAGMAQMYQR